jgi:hypothetical protein
MTLAVFRSLPGIRYTSLTHYPERREQREKKILARGAHGMARVAVESGSRQIKTLFEWRTVDGLTYRQLLGRFTARRDAAGVRRSPPW